MLDLMRIAVVAAFGYLGRPPGFTQAGVPGKPGFGLLGWKVIQGLNADC